MFCRFLEEIIQPRINNGTSVCMIDNASIHHTHDSRDMFQQVFEGLYYYSPPYSPHLKPIEPSFALVKEFIRDNEEQAVLNPVGFIDYAFLQFAIDGPRANSVRGHWNKYVNLYANYLRNN